MFNYIGNIVTERSLLNHIDFQGLSKDLVIERHLMRALKVTGGITMKKTSELQEIVWLYSRPHLAAINE